MRRPAKRAKAKTRLKKNQRKKAKAKTRNLKKRAKPKKKAMKKNQNRKRSPNPKKARIVQKNHQRNLIALNLIQNQKIAQTVKIVLPMNLPRPRNNKPMALLIPMPIKMQ